VSIGETLAQARGRAGLTVASVSQRTRIRETIIRDIEADNFSGCGGDFYARGHIRSIAAAVGTDPEPLVWEYDKTHGAPVATTAADAFEPVRPVRMHGRRGSRWPILLLALLVVAVGTTGYFLVAGSSGDSHVPQASQTHRVTKHHASPAPTPSQHTTSPASPTPAPPSAPPVRPLTPASVTAFGPGGSGQGDNAPLAHNAIDGRPGSAWHTDWYTTPEYGGLQHGTGLLLNMGRLVTITSARFTIGGSGAAVQLRAGNAPSLAQLKQVAHAADAGGVVNLRLATPAHGRYLLIWITKLPPDSSGTFQASVSGIQLSGQT
jgi:hypothetical protein